MNINEIIDSFSKGEERSYQDFIDCVCEPLIHSEGYPISKLNIFDRYMNTHQDVSVIYKMWNKKLIKICAKVKEKIKNKRKNESIKNKNPDELILIGIELINLWHDWNDEKYIAEIETNKRDDIFTIKAERKFEEYSLASPDFIEFSKAWWNKLTGNKRKPLKIREAYSNWHGDHKVDPNYVENVNKRITVNLVSNKNLSRAGNPGGFYMQSVLRVYFDVDFTVDELQNFLDECYSFDN